MKVLYVSFVIVIIDQVTKLLVKGFSIPMLDFHHRGMEHGQRIPIIGDFFRLTFIENPGMAFGLDPGIKFKVWVSLFSLVASIGLIIYIYLVRKEKLSLRLSLAFILGGAIGNLIDRMFYGVFYDYAPLFYGKVVDFLDFDFFSINIFGKSFDRWPIFNIADMAVTTGVLILILFYKKHTESKKDEEEVSGSDFAEAEKQFSSQKLIGTLTVTGRDKKAETDSESANKEENPSDNEGKEDGETDKGKEIPL